MRPLPLLLAFLAVLAYGSLVPRDPLWFDEVFTANLVTFRAGPAEVVRQAAGGDAHPPLFYLYAWACARAQGLWGEALEGPPEGVEERLRACNLPVVGATAYALGAFLPPPLAVAGTGLLLATPSYGQKAVEARMYPTLGLFLLLALAGALSGRTGLLAWSSLLAFYTHYLALIFLGPVLLAEGVWRARREGLRGLLPFWPLLLFLPWAPVLARQAAGGANAWLRPDPVLALYAYQDYGGHVLVFLLLLALLLAGVWVRRGEREGVHLLLVALFPALWWLSGLLLNTVSERYFGAFAPAFLLAALFGAPRGLSRLALPGLLLAALLGHLAFRLDPPRFTEDYRLISAFLGRLEARLGPVTVLGNERGRLMALRYYHRSASEFRLVEPSDLEDPPRPFVFLVYPGALATDRGLLFVELDRREREEGRVGRMVPPLSPLFLVYWR